MKLIIKGAFCAILALFSCVIQAQGIVPVAEPDYNKPKLFAAFPQSIDVQLPIFESLLPLSEGSAVRFALGSYFFQGSVVSKSGPADKNVQSVVIRSTNFIGAAFTFTKIITDDGSFLYRGRIISQAHSDAFELGEQNGQYIFTKKHQLRMVNE
jgi:hypothetical protein